MMKTIMFIAAAALSAPAFAQATPPQNEAGSKGKDPNRKICERVEQIGSRLSASKVCMTAAEWEEHRRTHQDDMDKTQRMQTANRPYG